MRPSIALQLHRTEILALLQQYRSSNPRVFGSVVRGSDEDGSDLDLLVDVEPGTTLFDLGGLQIDLEKLLGVKVDVLTPADLSPRFRAQVISEAKAL
ncbi:MAG: nucleotidyltransferase family protein [Methylococcaceae bacterium]|jgi:uncharacterized protein